MMILTMHASGCALPAEVWERYAVPARWPEWAPQIGRVDATAERLAPGVTGRVFGALGTYVDFVVNSVHEDTRRWGWSVRRGAVQLRLEHGVTAHPRGCATSLRVEGPLPVVLGLHTHRLAGAAPARRRLTCADG